jgi:uncharacterized protein YvpB
MTKSSNTLQWFVVIFLLLCLAGGFLIILTVLLIGQGFLPSPLPNFDNFFLAAPSAQPALVNTSEATLTASPTPFQPLPTATATATYTSTPTATSTFTPTSTSTITPSPTPTQPQSSLPSEAYIDGFYGNAQWFNLDCEARSAVDLAAYYGIDINEMEFLERLPRSDNPEKGFVGDYRDSKGQIPPSSYGVHAGPVADLLRDFGLQVEAKKGLTWKRIRKEISAGRPVIAWVINNTLPGYAVEYTSSDGETNLVASFEHTVIIIGYDQNYVTIQDGGSVYQRTISQFLDSWGVLGNMAILVTP